MEDEGKALPRGPSEARVRRYGSMLIDDPKGDC
jgi:hypothetical protein